MFKFSEKICSIFFIIIFLFSFSIILQAQEKNILIVTVGGAITGTQEDNLSGKFKVSSSEELLGLRANEINSLANISFKHLYSVASQDLTKQMLIDMGKEVNSFIKQDNIDAVIVTHGTDTLEETAYFLNLTVNTTKPIIITGSLRASLHVSSDSIQNLIDSVRVAIHPNSSSKGVLVVANTKIVSARHIQKTKNYSLEGLSSNEIGVLGYVYNEIVDFYVTPLKKHTFASQFNIESIKALPDVDIVYGYIGNDSLNYKNKSKGIVVAGVGSGNIHRSFLNELITIQEKGVQVVRSTRVKGDVVFNAKSSEINDSKYNFVAANSLTPEKARILLMLALTQTSDPQKIQSIFNTY